MLSPISALALTLAASSSVLAALPRLGGVNIAGLEFGISTDGSAGNYVAPPMSQIAHFSKKGANLFRIPFGWQYLTPSLGGSADATYLALLDSYVQEALKLSGTYVMLDLHNYARWNGGVVGEGGPTDAQFASLWTILAKKYAGESRVIYGIMNEPHDGPSVSNWVKSSQAAVTAIRDAGATGTILLPGTEWSHIQNLISEAGPALVSGVKDPFNNLGFDVHAYLDSDGSGTQGSCATDNVELLKQLASWLKSVNMQAILSETGVPNNAQCISMYDQQLAYVASVPSQIAGFAAWAAGSFAPDYLLGITPSGETDNDVAIKAVIPNFPGAGSAPDVIAAPVMTTSSAAPVRTSSAAPSPIRSSSATAVVSSKAVSSAPASYTKKVSSAIKDPSSTKAAVQTTALPSSVQVESSAVSTYGRSSSAAPSVKPTSTSVASPKFSTVIPSSSSSSSSSAAAVVTAPAVQSSEASVPTVPSSSALGGFAVPEVIANADASSTVADRSDFKNSWDAANFACDHQFQLCQRAANQQGSTFSVNECDAQSNKCKSSTVFKRSHINWARHH